MKKYPVVTLCGSTRFKDEFYQVQKDFTLRGYIVISVGFFGYSSDENVWESMDESTLTQTKMMLDDIHKSKIDMADEVFVVNPGGYVGDSTWSEICYARMLGKRIGFIYRIADDEIEAMVEKHIKQAEELAWQQYDIITHSASDMPFDVLTQNMIFIKYKNQKEYDPWVPNDGKIPVNNDPYVGHGDKKKGFDPFKIYGKDKMARFIENIIMQKGIQSL